MDFLLFLVNIICEIFTLIILFRVVMSWISVGQTNPLTSFLFLVTEPMLAPLRRILPKYGNLDFSPAAAVIILRLVIFIIP